MSLTTQKHSPEYLEYIDRVSDEIKDFAPIRYGRGYISNSYIKEQTAEVQGSPAEINAVRKKAAEESFIMPEKLAENVNRIVTKKEKDSLTVSEKTYFSRFMKDIEKSIKDRNISPSKVSFLNQKYKKEISRLEIGKMNADHFVALYDSYAVPLYNEKPSLKKAVENLNKIREEEDKTKEEIKEKFKEKFRTKDQNER